MEICCALPVTSTLVVSVRGVVTASCCLSGYRGQWRFPVPRLLHPHSLQGGSRVFCVFFLLFSHLVAVAPCLGTECSGDVSVPHLLHPHSSVKWGCYSLLLCLGTECSGDVSAPHLLHPHSSVKWGCYSLLLCLGTECSGDVSVPHLFHPYSLSVIGGLPPTVSPCLGTG